MDEFSEAGKHVEYKSIYLGYDQSKKHQFKTIKSWGFEEWFISLETDSFFRRWHHAKIVSSQVERIAAYLRMVRGLLYK